MVSTIKKKILNFWLLLTPYLTILLGYKKYILLYYKNYIFFLLLYLNIFIILFFFWHLLDYLKEWEATRYTFIVIKNFNAEYLNAINSKHAKIIFFYQKVFTQFIDNIKILYKAENRILTVKEFASYKTFLLYVKEEVDSGEPLVVENVCVTFIGVETLPVKVVDFLIFNNYMCIVTREEELISATELAEIESIKSTEKEYREYSFIMNRLSDSNLDHIQSILSPKGKWENVILTPYFDDNILEPIVYSYTSINETI